MNPIWVHRGEEIRENYDYMVEDYDYEEDQPAGWEEFGAPHSSTYSNAPASYPSQSSYTSSFPNITPRQSYFGSHPQPHFQSSFPSSSQQQPFTFTTTDAPSNTRGRTLQHGDIPQGQPGALTRGYFTNAIDSVHQARRGSRRGQPPPVARISDRREPTPRSKKNDDTGKKNVMDQVRDAGVVTNLRDTEVQEETKEAIDELLFKLRQVTEERDRLVTQLRTAKRKHANPVEEKEQPPSKRIDRGPRTTETLQITPTSSLGIGHGSQLAISVPPSMPPSSREPSQDDRDIVMEEGPAPTAPAPIAQRQYEGPIAVTPVGRLQDDDEPPRPIEPTPTPVPEDPFGLDESDESEPETRRRRKGKGKRKDSAEVQREHALNTAGPIPPFWRIRLSPAGFPERDNAFRHMLDRGIYASRYDNRVYAGRSAYQAANIEENKKTSCGQPKDHAVYHRVPYGMPMTGTEVNRLISLIYDHRVRPAQRGEAFMLLREFREVASRVIPEYRDRAMQQVLDRTSFDPNSPPKIDLTHTQMYRVPRFGVETSRMRMPDATNVLHVDVMGLYILLHGRPGRNFFSGVVIDHAFRVNRRSVFGYGLGRLITPGGREPHFRRLFACLLALPRMYREAVVEYNRHHPGTPFIEQPGPTYNIRRPLLNPGVAANTTMQDVIDVLIDNRIPPSWIDHGYTHGLNFINHNITNPTYRGLFDTIDNERHARLRAYGTPPAIHGWDGWRYPSNQDIARLHTIIDGENRAVDEDFRNERGWAVVGTTGLFECLEHRPQDEVQEYARHHPVPLPHFPELGDIYVPHPPPPDVHSSIPSSSAVDHTTVQGLGGGDDDMGMNTDFPPLVRLTAPADAPPAQPGTPRTGEDDTPHSA